MRRQRGRCAVGLHGPGRNDRGGYDLLRAMHRMGSMILGNTQEANVFLTKRRRRCVEQTLLGDGVTASGTPF